MLLYKIRRQLVAFVLEANILSIIGCALAYVVISYALLRVFGEAELVAPDVFFYWLIVTASTVGYGDYSPVTQGGRIVTAIFVIPAGLSLFAICIGKIGFYLSEIIQRGKKGLRMSKASNHCIIIGWNEARTLRLINLLLSKHNSHEEKIVLCHNQPMENPLPSKIEFVRVDGYTDIASMSRAAIDKAARIIIDTKQDDITFATALFCQKQNSQSHITVYFEDESHSDLMQAYCPSVEVIPSVSVEMIARASIDPGSASLHQNLLDPGVDASQFSIMYNESEDQNFGEILALFRAKHQAIAIAIKKVNCSEVDINPPDDVLLSRGDVIYYIADKRIANIY